MSKQYVEAEIKKIVKSKDLEFPLNMAFAASWILAHFKGFNIKIYDARGTSSLSDFFVIATMENVTSAKAAFDSVSANLKKHGQTVLSAEGTNDAEWILLDMGDLVIHIFQENSRDIFNLDKLWQDIPQLQIPQEYYSGEKAEVEEKTTSTSMGYF